MFLKVTPHGYFSLFLTRPQGSVEISTKGFQLSAGCYCLTQLNVSHLRKSRNTKHTVGYMEGGRLWRWLIKKITL